MQQAGPLRLVEGSGTPVHGWDVKQEIIEVLNRRLPDISQDDPLYVQLRNLRLALGGCQGPPQSG